MHFLPPPRRGEDSRALRWKRLAVGGERFCGLAVLVNDASEIRDAPLANRLVVLRKLRRVAVPGNTTMFHGVGERKMVTIEITYDLPVGNIVTSASRGCCSNQVSYDVRR